MIYLDYAASTPIDEKVTKEMNKVHIQINPHADNTLAKEYLKLINTAKLQILDCLNVTKGDITFTSNATESNNIAIMGLTSSYPDKKHIISTSIEHEAVLNVLEHLKTKGYKITLIKPNSDGVVTPKMVSQYITKQTILVSIMHINNEIGTVMPVNDIANIAKKYGAFMHVDAAQSIGKIPFDCANIDLVSLSSHKSYGPVGVGALYQNQSFKIQKTSFGGNQQYLKSGTMPTNLIVGMGMAFAIAKNQQVDDYNHAYLLKTHILNKLKNKVSLNFNGVPFILSLFVKDINVESLLFFLQNYAVSRGSACSTEIKGQKCIFEITQNQNIAYNSIRVSFGRFVSISQINLFCHDFNKYYDLVKSYAI